jgi:hypothetical protein
MQSAMVRDGVLLRSKGAEEAYEVSMGPIRNIDWQLLDNRGVTRYLVMPEEPACVALSTTERSRPAGKKTDKKICGQIFRGSGP